MLDSLSVVCTNVLTLFLLMAVGFVLGKKGMLTSASTPQMSKMLLYVVIPAVMIDTFIGQERSAQTVRALLIGSAVLVATYILNMLLMQLFFRRAKEDDRGILRFCSMYGNAGFMGIPLIQSVLGGSSVIYAVVALAVMNISIWTHGSLIVGGRKMLSLKKAFLNPGVIGFGIAMLIFALGIDIPVPISKTVSYIGSMNTPLAMVIVGAQIADVNLREIFSDRKLYMVSAVKLLVVPVITMLVLLPFNLDSTVYMAVVILSACPVASAGSMFCQIVGKDPYVAARGVTLTAVLCIATLPVMSALAQLLGGV